jgi:hypothetical protein
MAHRDTSFGMSLECLLIKLRPVDDNNGFTFRAAVEAPYFGQSTTKNDPEKGHISHQGE